MSGKSDKRLRRTIRKQFEVNYINFLQDVSLLKFKERFRIAWQVLFYKEKEGGKVKNSYKKP